MSHRYRNRKEKIQLLTDIMRGKKSASDIERSGCIEVVVWSQDEAGIWRDDKGVRTMTSAEVQVSLANPQSAAGIDVLHVFIIAPNSDEE